MEASNLPGGDDHDQTALHAQWGSGRRAGARTAAFMHRASPRRNLMEASAITTLDSGPTSHGRAEPQACNMDPGRRVFDLPEVSLTTTLGSHRSGALDSWSARRSVHPVQSMAIQVPHGFLSETEPLRTRATSSGRDVAERFQIARRRLQRATVAYGGNGHRARRQQRCCLRSHRAARADAAFDI